MCVITLYYTTRLYFFLETDENVAIKTATKSYTQPELTFRKIGGFHKVRRLFSCFSNLPAYYDCGFPTPYNM